MKIYLVRHTTVNLNNGICYGQSDVPVSNKFNEELSIIKNKLFDIKFDKIYSSPLNRCIKLSEKLSNNEQNIITDSRIMEMNFGDWELIKWDDIDRDLMDEWGNDFVNIKCPNGESYLDLYNRVMDFYSDITHSNNNTNNILVITHSGVIRSIMTYIKGIDLKDSFKFKINYGTVVKISIENNTYSCDII